MTVVYLDRGLNSRSLASQTFDHKL